jgi:hypothetical protein
LLCPRPANPPGHWCRSIKVRAATENCAGKPNRECVRISRLPPTIPEAATRIARPRPRLPVPGTLENPKHQVTNRKATGIGKPLPSPSGSIHPPGTASISNSGGIACLGACRLITKGQPYVGRHGRSAPQPLARWPAAWCPIRDNVRHGRWSHTGRNLTHD